MIIICNLVELRQLPDGAARRSMESMVELCHGGNEEIILDMEEGFDGPIGGFYYLLEPSDDPRAIPMEDGYSISLFSEEWSCCDSARLLNGCYFIFWGTNNAGGPCLFVPNESWISNELREWLDGMISQSIDQETICHSQTTETLPQVVYEGRSNPQRLRKENEGIADRARRKNN